MGVDDVCLSNYNSTNTCANNFNFFLITDEAGLSFDGILGFGPPYSYDGPSYMASLVASGSVSEAIASFSINGLGNQSEI